MLVHTSNNTSQPSRLCSLAPHKAGLRDTIRACGKVCIGVSHCLPEVGTNDETRDARSQWTESAALRTLRVEPRSRCRGVLSIWNTLAASKRLELERQHCSPSLRPGPGKPEPFKFIRVSTCHGHEACVAATAPAVCKSWHSGLARARCRAGRPGPSRLTGRIVTQSESQ